jgi:hypothetical protein
MKRKWKWLILLCLPVLLFAVLIWSISGRQIPVVVIGELPRRDVDEIVAAAKREMRREIFPNFSWQSIKGMPKAIERYSSIKLFTIIQDMRDGDAVIISVWNDTNGFSSPTLSNEWLNSNWTNSNSQLWLATHKAHPFVLNKGLIGWTNRFPRFKEF